MNREKLSEEQKKYIMDLIFNTKMTYKGIVKKVGITIEELYKVIEEYCRANNCNNFIRGKDGVQIQETRKRKQKSLENAQMIKEWADINGRKPRQRIKGVKVPDGRVKEAVKIEELTEEQKEVRLARALTKLEYYTVRGYDGKEIEEIKNEEDREIVRIIRYVNNNYESNKPGKKKKETRDENSTKNNRNLAKAIFNLIKTRHATVEQIEIMAKYYGVDLGELELSLEEQEDELNQR